MNSLHDINVLQGLPLSRDDDFWRGKRLYQVVIDEYFMEARPAYSIDHLFKLWRKGLIRSEISEGLSREESFPFACEDYKFVPLSEYDRAELIGLIKKKQKENIAMEIGIVSYFLFLGRTLSRTSDRFFRWVMMEQDKALGIFSLFIKDNHGTLIMYRHSTMKDMLTGVLLVEYQAFHMLGCLEVENLISIPSELTTELDDVSLVNDKLKVGVRKKGSQYSVVSIARKAEDFTISIEEILSKYNANNRHPIISLLRGERINL